MSKDIAFFCAVILTVAIGAFAGSAAALSIFRHDEAQKMHQLRAEVEPRIEKLFQAAAR